ncbi:MAG TPA: iron-containing redox enzyme family protein [Thermoanaerobaculia bacterium]|nr:iron-containing redox enzyme family protein [Thermoanaerobaculia bacterium]
MSSATETSFADLLLGAARPHAIAANPFVDALRRGACSIEQIRAYAEMIAVAAIGFPHVIANVLAFCDRPRIRELLLGNLLEEEGVIGYRPGHGVVMDPARSHAAMARRFAAAAGVDAERLARADRHQGRWYRQAAESGDWIGAFAYFAIGYEANVPESFRLIHPALIEHYGFAEDDLIFFTEHMTADERHGRESAEILAEETSEAERRRALEGARRGGMAWWILHRNLALA